jgi:hypothetical protein
MQQFLNFFPLPQRQGSFRPTFCLASGLQGSISRGAEGQVAWPWPGHVSGLLAGQLFQGEQQQPLGVALKFLHPLPVLFLLGLLNGKLLVVFGKPFPGTEQEISSSFEHLEGDTKDVCFLVSILQVRVSNYPKTLSSTGFYGGYTPFSDSY